MLAKKERVERQRTRTDRSFCVPKQEIAAKGYYLSPGRYKEIADSAVEHEPPESIIEQISVLGDQISIEVSKLEEMLG
ncbi:MAG TPA: hypothetical protein VKI44_17995 [Acetobacteraceae bacterium]|nr:hypothetical protein [Acetobacteraceae bacterium]